MTPGLYLHRDSPVHRLPAGPKLGGLLAATAAVLAAPGPSVPAAGLVAVGGLYAWARLPVGAVFRQLRPVLAIMLAFFLLQAWLSEAGWLAGLETAARFMLVVLLAALVTLTTRVGDMTDVFERAFAVLRPVGVNPAKAALMMALTVRFVPLLAEQVREIRMAQRARGVEASVAALFVPLLVKTLTLADDLTHALDARGWDAADDDAIETTEDRNAEHA